MRTLSISKAYDLIDERAVSWGDGITLWIAPLSTKAYQEHMEKHARWEQTQRAGMRRSAKADASLEEKRMEAMREGIARYIIRRWEGVLDVETGGEVVYSHDLGLELLTENPSFFADVIEAAAQTDAYRRDRVETAGGNLPRLSGSGVESESSTPVRASLSSVS